MMYHIRKCIKCGIYTLEHKCNVCGSKTIKPNPLNIPKNKTINKYRILIKMGRDYDNRN